MLGWGFRGNVSAFHSQHTVAMPLKTESTKSDNNTEISESQNTNTDDSRVQFHQFVEQYVPAFKNRATFSLTPYLFNGHLQSIYSSKGDFSQMYKVHYGRIILEFPDGGSTTADFVIPAPESSSEWDEAAKYQPKPDLPRLHPRTRYLQPEEIDKMYAGFAEDDAPILVIIHGLAGGSHEPQIRAFAERITEKYKFHCVVLNLRGCARSKLTNPVLQCGASTEDIRNFVGRLREKFPSKKLYGVGFSFGATLLANYVGQESDKCPLSAAVTISNPWDLLVSSLHVSNSTLGKKVYGPLMSFFLYRMLKSNYAVLKTRSEEFSHLLEETEDPSVHSTDFFDPNVAKNMKSIKEFDNRYTAPLYGFLSANDYYRKCSSINNFGRIRIPLLSINALDDPMVGPDALPLEEAKCNPYTYVVATDIGGHLGWFQPGGKVWYVDPLTDFLSEFHSKIDHEKGHTYDKFIRTCHFDGLKFH